MMKDPASTSASAADMQNTITITDDSIVMIAHPSTVFKLIRAINHWINNLIQYHPSPTTVNKKQEWYLKWTSIYKYIRRSKQTYLETYHLLTGDYGATTSNTTVFDLVQWLIDYIPVIDKYYDIKPIDGHEDDKNHFEFSIKLFYCEYKDKSNPFSGLQSETSFVPFTSNHSITTWKTRASHASSTGTSSQLDVPKVVHTDDQQDDQTDNADNNDDIGKTKTISDETGLSYSQTNLSPSALNPNDLTRGQAKNRKKTQDLKQLVSNTCKNEIKAEMGVIKEEMEDFKTSIKDSFIDQTNELADLIQNALQPVKSSTPMLHVPPSHTIPSTYRASMPSPTTSSKQKMKTPVDSTTPTTPPLPVKTPYESKDRPPYQKSGTIVFTYEDSTYELRDNDFHKHSANLMDVTTVQDLVNFYKQLQLMAVTYNIFLQQFDNLKPWTKTPNTIPPTCIFPVIDVETNTIDAYRRMKSALYTKLSKVKFLHPEHKAIISHGSIQQDGFELLYDLMTQCHPKLISATSKIRKTNHRPTFDKSDSIYSYTTKLQTWLDIELISHHTFTDDEILNIVMEQLREDTRYETAVTGIESELTLSDAVQRRWGSTTFPEGLKLQNLPATIMSYYSEDDKKSLFPTEDSTSGIIHHMRSTDQVSEAIINSINGRGNFARTSTDTICPGCGKYGHNIFHQGCDFCANLLLANDFFKKYPKASTKVLQQYNDHQKKRKEHRNKSDNSSKPTTPRKYNNKQYNLRSSKGKVRMLTDVISDVLQNSDDDSESEQSFVDANGSIHSTSDTEQE